MWFTVIPKTLILKIVSIGVKLKIPITEVLKINPDLTEEDLERDI